MLKRLTVDTGVQIRDTAIQRLQRAVPLGSPLNPSDVEYGATVVYQTGTAWAVGLSLQHSSRFRRDTRSTLDARYISTHYMSSEAMWSTVAGDGYCGYETLRR